MLPEKAVAEWTSLLGVERCLPGTDARVQAYQRDVGEYAPRAIPAILYPESLVEVQRLVRVANVHRVPLYSVSTGKNWGMGSRQPVEGPGVVVDLSRMNSIRAIDLDQGHAIVEPGVTQQALSEALIRTAYIANFTASTPETSLVGNVLDKGIGLYRHRVDDLLGIEVVTGAGDLLRVGGHWPMGRAMFHFPSGLGPTLTSLFLQSNFGIVTACVLKLIPRPETLHVLYATLAAERLPEALPVLKQLRAEHALEAVVKLYNAQAFHAYSGRTAAAGDRTFHLVGTVHGADRWVRHVSPYVADTLHQARCFDDVTVLRQDELLRAPQLVQALARIFAGLPTHFAVQRALALGGSEDCQEVDRVAPKGLIFIIPVVPLSGDAVREVLAVLEHFSKRHGVPINATINILSEHAIEMVSSILFDRTRESSERAHMVKHAILEELGRRDIPLMRLDIDSQNAEIFTEKNYRDVLVKLKRLFDPNEVIAPGRYIPRA
jgi:4-cresol dehydrogenase (hydroxylating) flavoprotein subunit